MTYVLNSQTDAIQGLMHAIEGVCSARVCGVRECREDACNGVTAAWWWTDVG